MARISQFCVVGAVALAAIAEAQDKVKVGGMIEQFFVSGGFGDEHRTRDRFTRFILDVEHGAWALRGSYWYYPFAGWYDLDETTVSYSDGPWRLRYGRFLVPMGQNQWDDQWYSGIIFIPLNDFNAYNGWLKRERTSIGADANYVFGNQSVNLAVTSRDLEQNHLAPDRLNQATLRYTWYRDGLTLGAAAVADTGSFGGDEQMLVADFRYTMPQWVFRGEVLSYLSDGQNTSSYFLDAYYRPKGWEDLTFVSRYENRKNTYPTSGENLEQWVLGAKYRLPFDAYFYVNYAGGPDMNNVFVGGGWSLKLTKTFRF